MFSTLSVLLALGERAPNCFVKYLVSAWVTRAAARGQRGFCRPTSRDRFFSQRICLEVQTGHERAQEGGSVGRHRPDSQYVPEYIGACVPRNRVRGAAADGGQLNGILVGKQDHGWCHCDAVGCTGGCLHDCRISVTTDIAPYLLDVSSSCRGYHLSVHVVVADIKFLTV